MAEAHKHLAITADEWDAFMDDLAQTLAKFDVPIRERDEVVTIIESTKSDIVTVAAVPAS